MGKKSKPRWKANTKHYHENYSESKKKKVWNCLLNRPMRINLQWLIAKGVLEILLGFKEKQNASGYLE